MKKLLAILMVALLLVSCVQVPPSVTESSDATDTSAEPADTVETDPSSPPKDPLTIHVATVSDAAVSNGSEELPFGTLAEARDYIRTLDKTQYGGITVLIHEGMYRAEETFLLTAEDSGTADCPITYLGEDGAVFYGGVSFTSEVFEPMVAAEITEYFPAEVQDKLLQLDLKTLGFTEAELNALNCSWAGNFTPLYMNGTKLPIARFPNEDEGWLYIVSGHVETDHPDPSILRDNEIIDKLEVTINFPEEINDRVHSWHDIYSGYVESRYTYLWFVDSSRVLWLDPEEPTMRVKYRGCAYEPRENMPFYFYRIPEELDMAGEYYISDDLIMYLYPTEGHETARYTMPLLDDNIITLQDAEHISFINLTLDTARGSAIDGTCNDIMIDGCTVQSMINDGIELVGNRITVQNCTVSSVGQDGISINSGYSGWNGVMDKGYAPLTRGDSLVYNNYIEDWSNIRGVMCSAIDVRGCGITVSHNEAAHSVDWGIGFSGAHILVEYNHLYDLARFEGDGGAIHITQTFDGVMRYNYIHDIGFDDDWIDFVGVNGFNLDFTVGQVEIYGNIVANITGNGVLGCGGRTISAHDNIFISCRRYPIQYTDNYYDAFVKGNRGGSFGYDSCLAGEEYLREFPWLADMIWSGDVEDLEDSNFWIYPAHAEIHNNFIYYDKGNVVSEVGVKGVATYRIWDVVYKFADRIDEVEEEEFVVYTSLRMPHPTIEEAISAAAECTSITMEEFNKIGRVTE